MTSPGDDSSGQPRGQQAPAEPRGWQAALQHRAMRPATRAVLVATGLFVVMLFLDFGDEGARLASNLRVTAGATAAVLALLWAVTLYHLSGEPADSRQPRPGQAGIGYGPGGWGAGSGPWTLDAGAESLWERLSRVMGDQRFHWSTGLALFVVVGAMLLLSLDTSRSLRGTIVRKNVDLVLGVLIWVTIAAWFLNWVRLAVRDAPPPYASTRGPGAPVHEQLYLECDAMAAYALQRGITPRPSDLETLETTYRAMEKMQRDVDQMFQEIDEAHRKAAEATRAGQGYEMPSIRFPEWDEKVTRELAQVHRRLAALVAPAMPKTLELLHRGMSKPTFPWLGTVRLVRMMVGLVVVLIPLFVATAINAGTRLDTTTGLFAGDVLEKIETALYLIVTAALGAAFAGLFKAFRYIGNLSYDEKYESSYWLRFILGVVAGLILAISIAQAFFTDASESDTQFRITIPLLALIGGFSSDLVYRILKRILDAVETLIQGSASDLVDTQKLASETRLKAKELESRDALVAKVLDIQEKLPPGATAARARIQAILAEILDVELAPLLTVVKPDGGEIEVAPGTPVEIELAMDPAGDAAEVTATVPRAAQGVLTRADEDALHWTFTPATDLENGTQVELTFTLADAVATSRVTVTIKVEDDADGDEEHAHTADGEGRARAHAEVPAEVRAVTPVEAQPEPTPDDPDAPNPGPEGPVSDALPA